jgi:predicted 3-demethylubiquinone-9 3-methyltransferase (glyoxalase superfamily)
MKTVSSFLMFQGNDAEEAITFYTSLIEDSEITSITRYGAEGPGKEGSVIQASFTLKGQSFMCIDSYVKHAFTFTPSFSIFLTCDSEEEIDRLFEALSTSGSVLMPLGEYPFAKRFGWLADRFGISWQLSLPNA